MCSKQLVTLHWKSCLHLSGDGAKSSWRRQSLLLGALTQPVCEAQNMKFLSAVGLCHTLHQKMFFATDPGC